MTASVTNIKTRVEQESDRGQAKRLLDRADTINKVAEMIEEHSITVFGYTGVSQITFKALTDELREASTINKKLALGQNVDIRV